MYLYEFCIIVPPEYELEDDYIEAQAGESPILHFSVTSDPPLTENTRHVVTAENGGIVRRFKVQDNCITFRNVKTTDTGSYTIRCRNAKGLEGKATFELDISESADKLASRQSIFSYKANSLHNQATLLPVSYEIYFSL